MTARLKSLWANALLDYANGQISLTDLRFWENLYRRSLGTTNPT